MLSYQVTQRLMSVASYFDVRPERSDVVVMTVKGTLMTATPIFTLVEGTDGKDLGTLKGNFTKTKFQVYDQAGKEQASLEFPSIAIRKTLTMSIGGKPYSADSGLGMFNYSFRVVDPEGKLGLDLERESSVLRDRFKLTAGEGVSTETAVLASIAIHARYFALI